MVAQVADRFFNVRTRDNVRILVADGFRYLQETDQTYDVIYIDAFLKPSEETDATGKPLSLKTERFYKDMQKHLSQPGVVVFNVNPHPRGGRSERDPPRLRPELRLSHQREEHHCRGLDGVGAGGAPRASRRAKELDQRFKATFSFQEVLKNLSR